MNHRFDGRSHGSCITHLISINSFTIFLYFFLVIWSGRQYISIYFFFFCVVAKLPHNQNYTRLCFYLLSRRKIGQPEWLRDCVFSYPRRVERKTFLAHLPSSPICVFFYWPSTFFLHFLRKLFWNSGNYVWNCQSPADGSTKSANQPTKIWLLRLRSTFCLTK